MDQRAWQETQATLADRRHVSSMWIAVAGAVIGAFATLVATRLGGPPVINVNIPQQSPPVINVEASRKIPPVEPDPKRGDDAPSDATAPAN